MLLGFLFCLRTVVFICRLDKVSCRHFIGLRFFLLSHKIIGSGQFTSDFINKAVCLIVISAGQQNIKTSTPG
jgi:deoxyribose-phosphate aldolase